MLGIGAGIALPDPPRLVRARCDLGETRQAAARIVACTDRVALPTFGLGGCLVLPDQRRRHVEILVVEILEGLTIHDIADAGEVMEVCLRCGACPFHERVVADPLWGLPDPRLHQIAVEADDAQPALAGTELAGAADRRDEAGTVAIAQLPAPRGTSEFSCPRNRRLG